MDTDDLEISRDLVTISTAFRLYKEVHPCQPLPSKPPGDCKVEDLDVRSALVRRALKETCTEDERTELERLDEVQGSEFSMMPERPKKGAAIDLDRWSARVEKVMTPTMRHHQWLVMRPVTINDVTVMFPIGSGAFGHVSAGMVSWIGRL